MNIMSFLAKIFHWLTQPFQNILDAAEKAFKHLSEDEQLALQRASSFVGVITQIEKVTPDIAFNVLNKISPGLTKPRFEGILTGLAKTLSTTEELLGKDIPTTLENVSTHLNKYQGKHWVVAVQAAVGFVLANMTPEGTIIQKILMCLEYVYTHIISKQIQAVKTTV